MASTNSKHNSFELDESLGILTPDQMAESPLCDELPSLLLMSEDYQGYQGDGECSRPASPGKPNPMTDSDFFTESDADMHEDLHSHNAQPPLSGDRKAQIIDGRLYGCSSQQVPAGCPSFLAAEEMDSSGVYSDTDRTPRPEPEDNDDEFSPSKLSTLIMEQVNTIKNLVVSVPMEDETISCEMEHSNDNQTQACELAEVLEENKPSSTSTQIQPSSPRQDERDESSAPATKKHKMPKRNVVSKIKTMISSSSSSSSSPPPLNKEKSQEDRRTRRTAGCSRWDAVMNKIAQGQAEAGSRPSLKQVKSRVFAGMTAPPTRGPLPNSRKTSTQPHAPPPLKPKSRRSRIRGSESSLQTQSGGKSHNSSRNSSISDLSKTSPHSVRSKKREAVGRSRSPQSDNSTLLAASRRPSTLPTTPPHAHTPTQRNGSTPSAAEIKAAASASNSIRKSSSRRSLNSVNSKPSTLRDQNRLSGGGGKTPEPPAGLPQAAVSSTATSTSNNTTSTATSTNAATTVTTTTNTVSLNELPTLQHASAGFEALGVLVQYLVYNLDAFSTPQLKRDLEKMHNDWLKTKLELEEAEVTCCRLQEQLADQKKLQLEKEAHYRHQLDTYETENQMQLAQLMRSHEENLSVLENRLQEQAKELTAQYNQELDHVKGTQRLALEVAERTLEELKHNTAEELKRVQNAASQREAELLKRLSTVESNCDDLKEQSRHLMETMNSDKDTKLQATVNRCRELQDEVESLRTVLELRSNELHDLRRQNETLQVDAELLPPTLQKLSTAQARVEDLEIQLERKATVEKQLIQENRLLLESVHQESKQKKRLSQHNEELQWKLKQNSEVVNALVTDLSSKSSQMISLSPHNHSGSTVGGVTQKRNTPELLEFFTSRNNLQCQNHHSQQNQISPPQSPKVKAVVEKSDSVSWVLEIDESPEHMVNRLVRRAHSFRQASSCTPSPAHQSRTLPNPHKRQRSRTSQSMSSSTSSLRGKKPARARSFSVDSDCSDVVQKWDDDCINMETTRADGFSPVDRSDDNDDLIVVESVGDEVLSYIEIDAGKNNVQTELIGGEISSSESEGSVRSRRKESSAACDELLLINRDDGLRERGILPKDAAGEAMISEETSDDDVASRDSEVEDASSSSDESLSGSGSEMANGIGEPKIKTELQQQLQQQQEQTQQSLKQQEQLLQQQISKPLNVGNLIPMPINQLSDAGNDLTNLDLSWSDDAAELQPSVSEG